MTTIAANHEVMVADSMVTDGDQRWIMTKIERIGDSLVATAGSVAGGERFYAWLRNNREGKKPDVGDSFCALELNESGLWLYDANLYPLPVMPGQVHAIGSGAKAARGAALAGADIVRAVEIACEVDAGSGPPVVVYKLKEEE